MPLAHPGTYSRGKVISDRGLPRYGGEPARKDRKLFGGAWAGLRLDFRFKVNTDVRILRGGVQGWRPWPLRGALLGKYGALGPHITLGSPCAEGQARQSARTCSDPGSFISPIVSNWSETLLPPRYPRGSAPGVRGLGGWPPIASTSIQSSPQLAFSLPPIASTSIHRLN